MKKRKPNIADKKLRGEWAEMCFMVRATEHGLHVSKPWGEMRSYDFVVGRPGHFVSVQVKSTIAEMGDGYECTVRGGHRAYPCGSFDFLAAYAVYDNMWYIIPEATIRGQTHIPLYPKLKTALKTAKFEPYREAWHLLRDEDGHNSGQTIDINACVEESSGHVDRPPPGDERSVNAV